MQIVSIDGRDGVGKSEQVNLLRGNAEFHFTGRLVDYSNRWAQLDPIQSFNWWFKDLPFPELASIILESLAKRRIAYRHDKVNINDRGSTMFRAVCAATLATREQISAEESIGTIDQLFEREVRESDPEQSILLKSDPEYAARIGQWVQIAGLRNSNYLPWQTKMYAKYQAWLAVFMDHYYQTIGPSNIILVDSCILDTHNKLRGLLNRIGATNLQPVCDTLKRLVAFGGLSECGKSSFAEKLNTHHRFCRLKIKYFGEVVHKRGLEVNPTNLGRELLDFLNSHRHITQASIESLHGPNFPAYLKLLLGSRLKIVYLDTPEEVRNRRTARALGTSYEETRKSTAAKDSAKLSRGADRVKDIADVVFNNGRDGFEVAFEAFRSELNNTAF